MARGSDARGASARRLNLDRHHMEVDSSNARGEGRARSDSEAKLLLCTYCGRSIKNTAKENAVYGEVPYPCDEDVHGVCRDCGGDPDADTPEGRLGEALTAEVKDRLLDVAERFSPKARAKFLALPLEEQAKVVFGLLNRGKIL